MSWSDDASVNELRVSGFWAEYEDEIDEQFENTIVLGNGTEICKNCGSKNIKTSCKGNKYCADLCWVDKED
jgi:hypothetical protein